MSTDPAGVQINSNVIGAESTVLIQSGNPLWWAATQTSNRSSTGLAPQAVAYASQGDVFVVHEVFSDGDSTAVSRLNHLGALMWQQMIPNQQVLSVAVTGEDHVFMALADGTDVLFLLLNGVTGAITWQTGMDTGWSQYNFVVAVDSANNLIAAGSSEAQSEGDHEDLMLVKLNGVSGSISWSRVITDNLYNLKAAGVSCVGTDIMVSGHRFNGTNYEPAVFKLDSTGDLIWQKLIVFQPGYESYDAYAGQIATDVYGNIYVATSYSLVVANFNDVSNQTAATLIKLNSQGDVQWTRRIGPGPCDSASLSLSVDDLGDVYLAATTLVFGPGATSNFDGFQTASNKIVLARYNTQGTVIWQRYLDAPGLWENINYNSNSIKGNLMAVRADRLLLAGTSISTTIIGGPQGSLDSFVVQLPTSGDTIQIGVYKFYESRVPARLVNWFSISSEFLILDQEYELVSAQITLQSSVLAHQLSSNAPYQFQFEGDGTLKLPNDGDLQLTQNQTGWISIFGPLINNNNNIWFRAVTGDTDGNMYAVGEDASNSRAFLVKFDSAGRTLYAVRLQHDSDDSSRANAVWYDPTYNVLVVTVERTTGTNKSGLLFVDPDTGVVQNAITLSADADVIITDLAVYNNTQTSAATLIAAGSKFGEWRYWDATPQTGSTTSELRILRSVLAGALPDPYGDWIITGTGITGYANVTSVERYTNLTQTSIVTTTLGAGATFDVTVVGGEYTGVSVNNGGSNYVINRYIRIPGTSLGGASPANDLIIMVIVTANGAVNNVNVVSGTGVGDSTYTAVAGTSLTGSGFQFTLDAGNGATYDNNMGYNWENQGVNYLVGDVITISGTQLGAATPANDLTVTVTSVSQGQVDGVTLSGTHQQTTIKLAVAESVNFGGVGTWQVGESMEQECFVWTSIWTKSFSAEDGVSQDRLFSVAVDATGMIYTAGEGFGGVSGDITNVELALLTKLDSAGDLVWARVLNETDDNCQAKCVVVDHTRNLVVASHYSPGPGRTVISKLDTAGTLGWQLSTLSNDDSSVALDAAGNIYVVCESYYAETDDDALKVFKLSATGQVLWRRWLGTNSRNEMKNGRNIKVVGDNMFITAYTTAVDNSLESGFAARLPIDGGSLGEYDYYYWREDFYDVDVRTTNYVGPVDIQVRSTTVASGLDTDYTVTWYDQANNVVPVRDSDGGAIIFGDGSMQTSSATDIAQQIAAGGTRRLGMEDRGKHIYVTDTTTIRVPYDYDVAMPIGSTVVIINNSGGTITIEVDGGDTSLIVPGMGNNPSYTLSDQGMATLIKVEPEVWFMSGATLEVFAP